nr:immunoglobulin heavy chain junction region [Macaca mulatta]
CARDVAGSGLDVW